MTEGPLKRRLTSRTARALSLVLAVLGGVLAVTGWPGTNPIVAAPFDLEIYRFGGQALLQGGALYGRLPDTSIGINLPFTYPPLAAVLFVPLAVLPFWVAHVLFTLASFAALATTIGLVVRELYGLRGGRLAWTIVAVFAVFVWLGPVQETIGYGQINLILMALVVIDLLGGRGRWWQGSLVGLALAIKLTPAVFLAYYLMRRDWRQLGTGIVAGGAFTGVGFLVSWKESVQYWCSTLSEPSRIGDLHYFANQSLNGLLVRLHLSTGGGLLWFVLCALIGLALLALLPRLFAMGECVAAMMVLACYALLASPVSWSHHWVWVAPALLLLACWATRARSAALWALACVGALVFFSRIIWWAVPRGDGRELGWNWWQQLVGHAPVLWACGLLLAIACSAFRWPQGAAGTPKGAP